MTKKKPKESLAELQKQREDLEALLASIEEAHSEGSMPEEQFQEVKAQNDAKLQEINEKMDKLAMEGGGEAPPAEPAKEPQKEGESPAEEKPAEAPPEQPKEPEPEKPPEEAKPPSEPTPEPAPRTLHRVAAEERAHSPR